MHNNDQFSPSERQAVASIAGLYGLRMLGLFMVLPVLALYVEDYQAATPLLLGFALGVYGLTQALLQIPLGLASDRLGRKPIIVGGLLLFVGGSVLAAEAESIYGLIAGRALQGAGAIASTLMALVADVTREQNRTKAMASIGGSIGFAFLLAMILGPWISTQFGGVEAVFWVTAFLGVLGVLWAQWRLPAPQMGAVNRETQAVPAMISGVLKDVRLLRLDLGIFTLHLLLMAGFVAIPTVLTDSLQIPVESHWWVYLLLLGGSFFAMIPAIIAAERGGHMKPVFLAAIALAALSLGGFSLGFERGAAVALGLLFLFFVAFNLLEASLPSLVSKTAPAGTRGTAMGVYSTSQFLGAFVGGVLGGWLLPLYGVAGLFAVLALMTLLWLLVVFPMEAPRALSGVVLKYCDHDGYAHELEALPGVEEVVLVAHEKTAYAKVDRKEVDWGLLRPYLSE
ncbi:MFS transporter [Porticoccus sp. W117]|uniref:MFS transporter n=1 Tax=Porticoccus sp. W117 TaxID=3054777 RepID=UPI002594F767|nr:MFS transporter [Porticoccus sp. W117]MDM3872408.1 MFS transporter [Porticoccus sp. W117]